MVGQAGMATVSSLVPSHSCPVHAPFLSLSRPVPILFLSRSQILSHFPDSKSLLFSWIHRKLSRLLAKLSTECSLDVRLMFARLSARCPLDVVQTSAGCLSNVHTILSAELTIRLSAGLSTGGSRYVRLMSQDCTVSWLPGMKDSLLALELRFYKRKTYRK